MHIKTPIFHVGFPKAGSTTLQHQVFPYLTDFAYFGLYPDFDPKLKELYQQLFVRDGINFNLERARSLVDEFSIKAGNTTPIFSNEAGVGLMLSYPDVATKAERLFKVFSTNLKILIIVREQSAILASQYRDHPFTPGNINAGRPVSFANWISGMEKLRYFRYTDLLYYDHLADIYEDLFGPQNVLLLPLELMSGDPEKYAIILSDFIDADLQEVLSLSGQKPLNVGHSTGVNRLWCWRRYLPSDIRFSRLLPKSLYDATIQLLSRGSKDKVVIGSDVAKHICELYAGSNQRLEIKSGLDLRSLGYYVLEENTQLE